MTFASFVWALWATIAWQSLVRLRKPEKRNINYESCVHLHVMLSEARRHECDQRRWACRTSSLYCITSLSLLRFYFTCFR